MNSQNTLNLERVKIRVTKKGDTITTMSYSDSKQLFKDVLNYKHTDSLYKSYKIKSEKLESILSDTEKLVSLLEERNLNLTTINNNINTIVINKDDEIGIQNDIIKQKNKEIRRQKRLKTFGIAGSAALTIASILIFN